MSAIEDAKAYLAQNAVLYRTKAEALISESERLQKERDELRRRVAELIHYPDCWDQICYPTIERALENIDHLYQGCTECAEKALARIKAEAVREFINRKRMNAPQGQDVAYWAVGIDELIEYANQIEGGQ